MIIIYYQQHCLYIFNIQRFKQAMLSKLSQIDKKISSPLINLDNNLVSIILYPFTAFFHPKLIFLAFFTVDYICNKDKYTLAVYVLGTIACLITTTLLKKILRRDRPTLVSKIRKPAVFRKKQKNHSMPSGDSIQSALFVTFLYFLLEEQGAVFSYRIVCLVLFHIGVCCGRVYYMCHWFGDTLVATFLGHLIAHGFNELRRSEQYRTLFEEFALQIRTALGF